jgi:CheY-like chemotaxis protein
MDRGFELLRERYSIAQREGQAVRTILLVEDEDAIRACIAEGLGMAGYQVVAVTTTTEALRELEADRDFDLAVIDVKMPPGHPHGFSFGRIARLHWPGLLLVFMSGDAGAVEADGGEPPGPVLQKPVKIDDLLRTIEVEFIA